MDKGGENVEDDSATWYPAELKTICRGILDLRLDKSQMKPRVSTVGKKDTGKKIVIKERRKKLQEWNQQVGRILPF